MRTRSRAELRRIVALLAAPRSEPIVHHKTWADDEEHDRRNPYARRSTTHPWNKAASAANRSKR